MHDHQVEKESRSHFNLKVLKKSPQKGQFGQIKGFQFYEHFAGAETSHNLPQILKDILKTLAMDLYQMFLHTIFLSKLEKTYSTFKGF